MTSARSEKERLPAHETGPQAASGSTLSRARFHGPLQTSELAIKLLKGLPAYGTARSPSILELAGSFPPLRRAAAPPVAAGDACTQLRCALRPVSPIPIRQPRQSIRDGGNSSARPSDGHTGPCARILGTQRECSACAWPDNARHMRPAELFEYPPPATGGCTEAGLRKIKIVIGSEHASFASTSLAHHCIPSSQFGPMHAETARGRGNETFESEGAAHGGALQTLKWPGAS